MKRRGFIGTSGALAFSAILPGCSAGGTPERVSDRKEKQKKIFFKQKNILILYKILLL